VRGRPAGQPQQPVAHAGIIEWRGRRAGSPGRGERANPCVHACCQLPPARGSRPPCASTRAAVYASPPLRHGCGALVDRRRPREVAPPDNTARCEGGVQCAGAASGGSAAATPYPRRRPRGSGDRLLGRPAFVAPAARAKWTALGRWCHPRATRQPERRLSGRAGRREVRGPRAVDRSAKCTRNCPSGVAVPPMRASSPDEGRHVEVGRDE
jgi:hypothetical protein